MKSDICRVGGKNYEQSENRFDLHNSGIIQQQCCSERVEAASVVGVANGNNNAVELSRVVGERPQMTNDGSVKLVSGTETTTAGGAAGTVIRKRKILRKTVRIVKKVIKKRVPKRVLIGGTGIRGDVVKLEDFTGEEVDDLSGQMESEMLKSVSNANVSEEIVPKNDQICLFSTDADDIKGNDVVCEVERKHGDLEVGKAKFTFGTNEGENTMSENQFKDSLLENPRIDNVNKDVVPIGEESKVLCENTMTENQLKDCRMESRRIDIVDKDVVPTGEESGVLGESTVTEDQFKDCLMENPRIDIVDKDVVPIGEESKVLGENTMTEKQLKDCLMENRRIDIVDRAGMELLTGESTGRIGEESGVLGEKESGRTIVKDESCSYEVESDRVKFTEGLLLSEEIEAVERKKKRKAEIFLGGLSKGTKEEDIRAVFEDVGVVVDVRLVVNPKTGKNRGFGFVRFARAADATNALLKYSRVEICGKLCNTAPVEGNDTIFLGNIDRNWKTEDFVKLLEKAGIEKIDKVTLKADPNNTERNRGFAFLELQTSKDAQTAFNKLQKKDAFGKNQMVKVAWATLNEPAEEEILQVKSVYAEYLPFSWDEEKVKEFFQRFGEIESVVLAKNLSSTMRRDFAVINYTTRDAALTCIEAVNRERLGDDCSKVKMAVSLVKPMPKKNQVRHTFNPTYRQHLEANKNVLQTSKKLCLPRNNGKASSSSYDHVKAVSRPYTTSTTEELVQLLRQQASTNQNPPFPGSGAIMPDHRFLLPGSKRPFSQVGHEPLYVDSQQLSRVRMESSYQFSSPSSLSHGVDLLLPPYHRQSGLGFPSESIIGRRNYPIPFQTRDRASYYGDPNPYHRH